MPSTGTPSSSSSRSSGGASCSYTEAGPPDRITPFGRRRSTSAAPTWCGSSSEKTPHSRTRRAISCEYWPPKSSTTTSSVAAAGIESALGGSAAAGTGLVAVTGLVGDTDRRGFAVRAHPDALLALELLAFGLERRRDRQLGAVELGDVAVAAGRHRGPQRAHQVESAVVLTRGPLDDLLERPVLGRGHAGAARKRGMEGRHPPVEATAGGLVSAGQRRAEHHGVRAAGDRLGDVASVAHPAVGDHLDVVAGLEHVLRAGGGDVGDRGRLRDADPEHAAGGADRPGSHADEHAGSAGAHQVQTGVVGGAAAHDDGRRRKLADELLEVQRRPGLVERYVLGGDDGALDHKDVEARIERDLVVLANFLRRQRGGSHDALLLDLANPLRDQLGLDRLAVDVLHLACRDVAREGRDPLELPVGVLVAAEDALEVEDRQAAELADHAGCFGRDDAVERGAQQRQLEPVGPERPGDVNVVGIPRAAGRNDCDLVEAVCPTSLLAATDLYFHFGIVNRAADGRYGATGG